MLLSKIRNRIVLEDFSLLSLIGKGTFAKVVLVKQVHTQTTCVLKVIQKRQVSKKNQQGFVKLEKDILSSTNHPFLVKMAGSFQSPERLYFVLEYCPGGDLYGLISKRHRLTEDQTRFCASQIILALQYLHERNIVYRDLKPENVLVDKFGYLKLTDFGLSTICQGTQQTTFMAGTPQYLAPEIILKNPHGKAVDYWCLGNIIYQMVVGYPAFFSGSNEESFEKIRTQEPVFPPRTSSRLTSLLKGLLNKNPSERLGSNGMEQIKKHPWFSKTDWESVLKKELKSPFVPIIQEEDDISNFDQEFTQCEVTSWDQESEESHDEWDLSDFSCEKSREEDLESLDSQESSGEGSFFMKEQESTHQIF